MMEVSIETITPEIARKMLEKSKTNFRNLDQYRVKQYSIEMAKGRWELNGESIVLDEDENVDNGQHRLHAVLVSGVTIQCVVARGAKSVWPTIDRGKPRSMAQWIKHAGIKNAKVVAASTKMALAHDAGLWGEPSSLWRTVVDTEIMEYARKHNDHLQECISIVRPCLRLMSISLGTTIAHVASRGCEPEDYEILRWFFDSLGTGGENLSKKDPVYHLRNKLIAQKHQSQMSRFMEKAIATLAWNMTVKGEQCGVLRIRMTGPSKQKPPTEILRIDS